jgi:putative molybdopterin biosynthesis protein
LDRYRRFAAGWLIKTSEFRALPILPRSQPWVAEGRRSSPDAYEVADRLGVSLQRAYEMGRCGLLPIVRLGRQIRVEEARLMSWIESGGRALPGGWKRYPS